MEIPNTPLDLQSVRCFLSAVRSPSFRAGAKSVHLSPAAFGGRIQQLEQALGVILFERSTRSVVLTEAGERIVLLAERLFEQERAFREAAVDPVATPPFELTIGTRYELGLSWLLEALEPLQRERPERTLHLYFGDSSDLLPRVRTRRIDALVSSARVSEAGLEYAPLHEEAYVFVGAPAYLAKTPLRRAADATSHALIDTHADLPLFRYFLDVVPPEPAWAFDRIERMGTIAAIRARILGGHGVAVLPRYFVRDDLKAKRLRTILPRLRLKRDMFRLIWRAGHPRSRELRRLARALRAVPLQ